jgi:hypothetical protein
MSQHSENKYTVTSKILDLQSRVLALETANKELRQWVEGALSTKINDAKNLIQDSIRIPVDGAPGRDGVDGRSIIGPQGPAGDITTYGPEELQQAVIALRIKLKTLHATFLARLIEEIDGHKKGGGSINNIIASHLEGILREIEKLK